MKTIGEQLNYLYKKNQKILDSRLLKPGKVIFRPITLHVHAWFEQFLIPGYSHGLPPYQAVFR